MKLTKIQIKKLIGYLSSVLVLVFLGEPFLSGAGDVVSTLNADDVPAKADNRYDRY